MLRLSGYTAAEKQHIGRQYLEKQAAGEAGVPEGAVRIDDEAMSHLIVEYCRFDGLLKLWLSSSLRVLAVLSLWSG